MFQHLRASNGEKLLTGRLTCELLESRQMLSAMPSLEVEQPAVHDQPVAAANAEEAPSRHLVMITHGWNGRADGWVTNMRDAIAEQVRTVPSQQAVFVAELLWQEDDQQLQHAAPVDAVDAVWEVVALDWRDSAAGLFPSTATNNALKLGGQLAERLSNIVYDSTHLLAHSAGSWLIDVLVSDLEENRPETLTQATFWDAYTPGNQENQFGRAADWAEHYFDDGVLPFTNDRFAHALNIDLTAWGPDDNEDTASLGVAGHAWPVDWYLTTAEDPDISRWGFSHSISRGRTQPRIPVGRTLVLGMIGDSNEDGRFNSTDIITVFARGKFETGRSATWRDGDWNGDGLFNSSDLVTAFQAGTYQIA